jgi:hypothetical protein
MGRQASRRILSGERVCVGVKEAKGASKSNVIFQTVLMFSSMSVVAGTTGSVSDLRAWDMSFDEE